MSRLPVIPTLTLALALGGFASWARQPAMDRQREADVYEDQYYLPRPEWLALVSLGHTEALADALWMRLLIYYGEEIVHRGDETHLFDYADAILTLDPDFLPVYRRVGTLAIYGATSRTPEEIERSVALMERGAERFPDDGPLQWTLGATLAFELAPLYGTQQPELARQARERAAPYLVRGAELGAAPPYASLSNAALLERVGRAEEAARHLEEMYALTDDESLRAQMAQQIESLRSSAFATGFVEENRRFEDRWGREMPYAPAALYDLVGPIPVIDTTAILRDGFGAHTLDEGPVDP